MKIVKWEKLGLIFNPDIISSKGLSAALMPIAEVLDESKGLVRVYYSPRDKESRSEVHFFDFSLDNSLDIKRLSDQALIKHGAIGTFDDNGITLGSILNVKTNRYLFYTGWNLTVTVPMNNSIGIAKMNKYGNYERLGNGPIMTRTLNEPYSCASPFVLFEEGMYKMWYASMDKWEQENNVPKHFYNIKYAESRDGINWERNGVVCIDYENDDEYAFGRPFILKEDNLYKMWYCYRGDFYKIGYAESKNGIKWKRKDEEAGIDVSKSGWDSEMLDYPYIFDFRNSRYMLYNGNGYGKTGIGIAKLVN